jgi:ferredoxin
VLVNGPAAVRVSTDPEACCGAGQCAATAPGVFAQSDEDGRVVLLDPRPPADLLAAVRTAADRCPSRAIRVTGGRG